MRAFSAAVSGPLAQLTSPEAPIWAQCPGEGMCGRSGAPGLRPTRPGAQRSDTAHRLSEGATRRWPRWLTACCCHSYLHQDDRQDLLRSRDAVRVLGLWSPGDGWVCCASVQFCVIHTLACSECVVAM